MLTAVAVLCVESESETWDELLVRLLPKLKAGSISPVGLLEWMDETSSLRLFSLGTVLSWRSPESEPK